MRVGGVCEGVGGVGAFDKLYFTFRQHANSKHTCHSRSVVTRYNIQQTCTCCTYTVQINAVYTINTNSAVHVLDLREIPLG